MSPREISGKTLETGRSTRPYLQPLALAIVCLILISLLFTMRIIDLSALDQTLVGNIENRGFGIIRNIQQVAELYYQRLVQTFQADPEFEIGSQLTEEAFSLQEALIIDLIDSAQDLDYQLGAGRLGNNQLRSIAVAEGLWLIAVLDGKGAPILETEPVPEGLLRRAAPVVAGHEEVKINLFDQSGGQQETGFICIRRKFGKGAIIMGLDAAAFRYLRFKVAVKKAIENVGQAPDTSYFVVMDQTGRILGQAGERPGQKIEQILLDNIFQGKEAMTSHNIEFEGKRLVDIIAPIRLRDGFTGLARLGLSRERADQILKKNRRNIFVTTFFMVVIAVLAMWFLYKNQNRHLAKVQEMERRIQQANRLSAMGRLAAGVAHEIRNPLNAISMATQRLQSDNLHQLTGVIRDEIRRLNQIIEEFLGLSRSQRLKFSRQDLTELLGHIALLIEEEAASKGVKIKLNPGDRACVIPMDFDKLKQAFFNIVKNAMESISEKGDIDIVITPSGRDWVSVKITDSGTGLSPEEIKQIFDFDYTTKDKGLGLGLPLAHEIIRGHGGEIHVNSRQGEGTTFEVRLPPDRK